MKTVSRMPSSVEELLALHDEEFVDVAYQVILGRKADSSGKAHYLDRVRTGGSRHRVVAELALSDEARAIKGSLNGMFEHLAAYRASDRRRSLLSRLWNPDPFADGRWERRARRLKWGITPSRGHSPPSESPAVEVIFNKLKQAVRR